MARDPFAQGTFEPGGRGGTDDGGTDDVAFGSGGRTTAERERLEGVNQRLIADSNVKFESDDFLFGNVWDRLQVEARVQAENLDWTQAMFNNVLDTSGLMYRCYPVWLGRSR